MPHYPAIIGTHYANITWVATISMPRTSPGSTQKYHQQNEETILFIYEKERALLQHTDTDTVYKTVNACTYPILCNILACWRIVTILIMFDQ